MGACHRLNEHKFYLYFYVNDLDKGSASDAHLDEYDESELGV